MRRYLVRRPGPVFAIVGIAVSVLVTLSIQRIVHSQSTVHRDWAVAVGVGAGASLAFLAGATRAFWLTRRSARLARGLIGGIALLLSAGLIYTHAAVMPDNGQPAPVVTTPFQLGAITFMTPLYAFLGVFVFWIWHRSWTVQRQNI